MPLPTKLLKLALLPLVTLLATASHAQSDIVTVERFVPHVSTAPANEGQRVGIYLRERYSEAAADRWQSGQSREGRVVLFVHGGSVSSDGIPGRSRLRYLRHGPYRIRPLTQAGDG
jgi:hypothetical protein